MVALSLVLENNINYINRYRAFKVYNALYNTTVSIPQEEQMAFTLKIPVRRLESIFGIAYPGLKLDVGQKCRFIQSVVAHQNQLKVGDDYTMRRVIRVNVHEDLKSKSLYYIDVDIDGRKGYDITLNIERWCYSIRPLYIHHLIRFWNRICNGTRPVDSYLIYETKIGAVLEWLHNNAKISEYQMYSKFGTDVSLGFKNKELSTLFKLTFGDEEIRA